MKYKAVIFDLDGVICHTDEYHYQAWKQIAEELGIPFDRKTNDRLRGVSRMESLNIILEPYTGVLTEERKNEYADQKNERYRELLMKITEADLKPEVKETLDCLKEAGLKLAVGSSSKNTMLILTRLGLKDYFDAVCDGNAIVHSKPHPEVFLKAAASLLQEPEACLVVEDAMAGVKAALAGGMDCAVVGDAVPEGYGTYDIRDFRELVTLCGTADRFGS